MPAGNKITATSGARARPGVRFHKSIQFFLFIALGVLRPISRECDNRDGQRYGFRSFPVRGW